MCLKTVSALHSPARMTADFTLPPLFRGLLTEDPKLAFGMISQHCEELREKPALAASLASEDYG